MNETPSNSPSKKRVLIVDDHPVFRHGVTLILNADPSFHVCGEAETATAGLELARQLTPDILITDITMPGPNGLELIKSIIAEQPRLLILVLSMHEEAEYALRVIRAGAKGYVMKDEAHQSIVLALQKILSGEFYLSARLNKTLILQAVHSPGGTEFGSQFSHLSDREMEVFELIGKRLSTREIAESLHLSVKTIETHRAHIKEKLALKTADELSHLAAQWIASSQPAEFISSSDPSLIPPPR
ncbi:response regulator transcription factor [Phragmitibacter flavus]|uniref:Response regulator transcription factor n=1 Tax=Phragmitibacter flavus TaxID=2576071 RepID=A0A5R8KFI0_9BACT|nr:response regulator transcription factor [Phragmitibacter flavus]TLD71060.1 response regulator transcription factor [Phragmitibacter flavus]